MRNRNSEKKSYVSVISDGKIRRIFLNKDNSVDSIVEERMPTSGFFGNNLVLRSITSRWV